MADIEPVVFLVNLTRETIPAEAQKLGHELFADINCDVCGKPHVVLAALFQVVKDIAAIKQIELKIVCSGCDPAAYNKILGHVRASIDEHNRRN